MGSCQHLKSHDNDTQDNQHHAGSSVQCCRFCLIGKNSCDTRPEQGKDDTQEKYRPVRHTADHKVGSSSGQSSETHNKHAGTHSCLQLVAKDTGQDQEHHHTAACTDKATDKTDHHAADHGLDSPLFRRNTFHSLFCCHDRADNEFDTKKEGHEYGKASHSLGRNQAGNVASNGGKDQNTYHHDQAVFDIQVLVFVIGVSGNGTCEYVRGQGNTYRHVRIHMQECDQHGTYDRSGT
mgnify:CR=1 FL=1